MKILIKMMMMTLRVRCLDINQNKIKKHFNWEVKEENRYQIEL